jgi:hypothetical protein
MVCRSSRGTSALTSKCHAVRFQQPTRQMVCRYATERCPPGLKHNVRQVTLTQWVPTTAVDPSLGLQRLGSPKMPGRWHVLSLSTAACRSRSEVIEFTGNLQKYAGLAPTQERKGVLARYLRLFCQHLLIKPVHLGPPSLLSKCPAPLGTWGCDRRAIVVRRSSLWTI